MMQAVTFVICIWIRALLEFQLEHCISDMLIFASDLQRKCLYNAFLYKTTFIHFFFFPVHCSPVMLSLNAVQCEIMKMLLHKSKQADFLPIKGSMVFIFRSTVEPR
jgi:hypothetical protein